jgi:UDP-N-acetylglucosamine 2-epimerase (non-hydrolysing)
VETHERLFDLMRIAVIVGTRPEAIKIAPVIQELRNRTSIFDVVVIATAQHREMLDQALSIFSIKPDYDLNLMHPGQSLSSLSSRVMEHMESALDSLHPDMIMVQGDTTTVFISALAAFYKKIPVIHVEAGLRSHDFNNPFPEEANRKLTSVLADIHCAPTVLAKTELLHEGVPPEKIVVCGNTVVDALELMLDRPFSFSGTPVEHIVSDSRRIILVTCHRRESLGKDLEQIFLALIDIINRFPDVRIVYPVHLNPEVRGPAEKMLSRVDRIHLVPPLDYLTFINLMKQSRLILTDSGGMQEEAPTLRKPLLVMRRVTERPEAFQDGFAKVIGTERSAIVREASRILQNGDDDVTAGYSGNPYGDGKASARIADALERWSKGMRPLLEPGREFNHQGGNHRV